MSLTRTHTILDLEVTLEAGHRAWAAYEKLTGRSILSAVEFHSLMTASVSLAMVYEFGYALARKWMDSPEGRKYAAEWFHETWLDALPPVGSDSWNELHQKVADIVCQAFYEKTWAQMLIDLNVISAAIEAADAAADQP